MATVFMFPGQGSQTIGMGAELFARYPDLVAEADAILGYSIKELCLENPDGKLDRTDFTQPALYTVDVLSFLAKVEDEDIAPDFVIGHSLGEYVALYAAGAFNFAIGLKLVQKRGALMSAATGGGMAAILGMDGDAVATALAELGAMKEKGAKRVVVLSVSGAFHSRYMKPAAEEFEAFLAGFSFGSLKIPCIANCSAEAYTDESIAANLVSQIYSSVRWIDMVKRLRKQGADTFVEVGPGTVLSGLVRQI
jgi:malonyl CoA-acyl carrier protein transacylase